MSAMSISQKHKYQTEFARQHAILKNFLSLENPAFKNTGFLAHYNSKIRLYSAAISTMKTSNEIFWSFSTKRESYFLNTYSIEGCESVETVAFLGKCFHDT